MNMLWILDKEFDVAHNVSARLATIKYLEINNNIKVVVTFRKEKKYYDSIKSELIYVKSSRFPILKRISLYLQNLNLIKKKINFQEIDIVLLNTNNIFLFRELEKIKEKYSIRLIFDIRSLPVEASFSKKILNDIFFSKSIRYAARNFDGITYITEEMKQYCEKKYKLIGHKSTIWSSGVDTQLFKPSKGDRDKSIFRLMYHGAVSKHRGIENIIRAMSIIREYDIEFTVLSSGKEISKLKKLANILEVSHRVKFYPTVSYTKVPDYINKGDVGILPFPDWPGWNTSSPIKLFEYLACSKPVVVTNIPAHQKVLEGKEFAFWAQKSCPEDLAGAILESFKSRNNFQKIGKEARNFVELNYTWKRQIYKFEEFLKA